MQHFSSVLKAETPLETDAEYVPYDVESLFTNVSVRETTTSLLRSMIITS